ncbi:hypothetical protein [Pseudomonas sp. NPDC088890]|uniref:hypothetical protein n=1 Tax=Pseudomonas sp. NPDC088890 TaxID=3364458 RepID=UPI0038516207
MEDLSAHELIPGVTLPPVIHGRLRQLLAQLNVADTVVNILLVQERAEGVVECLELLKKLDDEQIEKLYLLIGHTAAQRFGELESQADGSPS